jgi:hypothetical protein
VSDRRDWPSSDSEWVAWISARLGREERRKRDIAAGMCPGCDHYYVCFDLPECRAVRGQ